MVQDDLLTQDWAEKDAGTDRTHIALSLALSLLISGRLHFEPFSFHICLHLSIYSIVVLHLQ